MMKSFFYKTLIGGAFVAGVVVGVAKGHDFRDRLVAKRKLREEKRLLRKTTIDLDEIEMASWHG